MERRYIIALDEGTTSARTIVYDTILQKIIAVKNKPFRQIFPTEGWVEHDAEEIWEAQLETLLEAVSTIRGFKFSEVYGIGITNQRETVVAWDKRTNTPICNAIVWQCRRTATMIEEILSPKLKRHITEKTGLVPDAYFSGTKIAWILENVKGARQLAEEGNLRVGTIDTWLINKLTDGETFVTDVSNASRTMLYNINTLEWDKELLSLFNIPENILPKVVMSSEVVGEATILESKIPIGGIAGDQQSALFGQCCFEEGEAKNTYGTGCFILMNTGSKPMKSKQRLLTTIAWGIDGKITYALEGSIFNAGSSIQWLRDQMGLIKTSEESEACAMAVKDTENVYVVPAFTGLGAPYWDMNARGVITGLTRGANKNHIVRATLESIAYCSKDIFDAMQSDSGINLTCLKVDGGASNNNFLMQFQADMLGCTLCRPKSTESTGLGAVYLAGLATGAFKSVDDIRSVNELDKVFSPSMPDEIKLQKLKGWKSAVAKALNK